MMPYLCKKGWGYVGSVDATREDFIRFIRRLHSDWTEYRYDLEEGTETEFKLIEPTYLPEGYREYDREELDNWTNVYYRNKETEEHGEIEYVICQAEGLAVGLDTEGAVIRTKEIGGENVEYFENDGIGYVYWTDEDTYYSFSGYVEVDKLLKIAVLMAAAVFLCGISINVSAAEGGESGTERRGKEISIMMVNISRQYNTLTINPSTGIATIQCEVRGKENVTKTSITATLQKKGWKFMDKC